MGIITLANKYEGGVAVKTLKLFNCKIPSDIGCVCDVVKGVIGFLNETYGLIDDNTVFDLKVIINELVLNAIKHGNKGDIQKEVAIMAGVTKDNFLFIIVEDEGEGYKLNFNYNPRYLEGITEICDMKETGRGILIVKSLCDKVKLNNRGNKIVVLKKLTAGS